MRIFISSLTVLVSLTLAAPTIADTCGLEGQLAAKGKTLTTTIGVPRRDREFIESLGIELRNGLFGAKYIETDGLLVALALKGCDATLIDWAVTRTRKAASSGGGSGDDGESEGVDLCKVYGICDGNGSSPTN